MKKAIALTVTCSALLLTGCSTVMEPVGGLITSSKWDGGVSNVGVATTKTGKSCARSILGFGGGDASITAAMADGGITKTANVDRSSVSVLGFYTSYCTIVTGE